MRLQVERALAAAGIGLDGANPWDILVKDERFFPHVAREGSLGLGEAYMFGWWDCLALDQLCTKMALAAKQPTRSFRRLAVKASFALRNMQSRTKSLEVAEGHYNLGNDMFEQMLDPYMQYSCAYWPSAKTLDEAQENKLALICEKLHLQSSDRVLEIGCGWGGLAKYMASKYGCHVTAVNISTEQIRYGRQLCAGLPVDIVQKDYRDVRGSFDKVVSIAMLEAVGMKNLRTYMETVHSVLKPEGTFLLHSIGETQSRTHADRWLIKYIFPNGHIPSASQLGSAFDGLFVMEDWHNFGPDYDRTLMAWNDRFRVNWPKISSFNPSYDERFYRMWTYYLLSGAGAYRSRKLHLWQIAFTKARTGTHYQRIAYR